MASLSKFLLTTLFCGAAIVLTQVGQAQPPAPDASPIPEDPPHLFHDGKAGGVEGLERLARELDLTASQQGQIKVIIEASHPQIQAIRSNTSLSKEERHAQIRPILESDRKQVWVLLTPDQQTKLNVIREKTKERDNGSPSQNSSSNSSRTESR